MKTINLQATIPNHLDQRRLDQALAKLFPEYSRSVMQDWIRVGQVAINGKIWLRPKDKIIAGQLIEIKAEIQDQITWRAQHIPLNIIFEDDSLLIINKPPGLVVHPGAGNPDNTLVNALLHHVPELSHLPRAGLIHRLDKDTSGLLVVAKSLPAHNILSKALELREIHREYDAIVNGVMIAGGKIQAPIGRHPVYRTRMGVVQNGGRHAITHYRVLERYRAYSRLKVQLETGRTHQIRVHFAHIHYPIVGDPIYNKRGTISAKLSAPLKHALLQLKRQALHARRLAFHHPKTGEAMNWEAPLPEDMQHLIQLLREDAHDSNDPLS